MLVAGGSSRRMGFDKLTATLAGRPLLWHSLRAFCSIPAFGAIVLVCAQDRTRLFREICSGFRPDIKIVPGGAERADSVLEGLRALGDRECMVAIHDAARPLITADAILGCIALAERFGASACAEPLADTVHRSDAAGDFVGSVPRDNLWRMQTPQVFVAGEILDALEAARRAGESPTDEVAAMLRAGKRVRVFDNAEWNFKVTYPRDIRLAEAVLAGRKSGAPSR